MTEDGLGVKIVLNRDEDEANHDDERGHLRKENQLFSIPGILRHVYVYEAVSFTTIELFT